MADFYFSAGSLGIIITVDNLCSADKFAALR